MQLNKEGMLKTSADDLFELVKSRKKMSVEDAAKILKLPLETVQALVDFLVEEKIFGLEYKFTTPYVYISKAETAKKASAAIENVSLYVEFVSKEDFYEKAKHRGILHEKIDSLWRKYLGQNLNNIKDEFTKRAKSKKIPEMKIESLWNKYLEYLM